MADLTFPVQDAVVLDERGKGIYNEASWGSQVWALDSFLRARGTLDGMCSWTFSDEGVADTRWHGCGWYDQNGVLRSPVRRL